ncbi:MAG: esterase/lipase family protein [Gemmatimonadaceae bacterium]
MHVLVVHGLARTRLSFAYLSRDLRRAGHSVSSLGYVAAVERFATVCARVRERLERIAESGEPYAMVGHSLGGLVLRIALGTQPGLNPAPRMLVLVGTPNRMPRRATRVRRLWPYRVLGGEAGQLLADPAFFTGLPTVSVPYCTIAGTAGRRGRWSRFGEELNDGTVSVGETRVSAGDSPMLLRVRHTFMLMNREVRTAVVERLNDAAVEPVTVRALGSGSRGRREL